MSGSNATKPAADHPEIVLFGTHCRFTAVVLQRLIATGFSVSLVILPDHSESGVRVIHHPTSKPRLPLIASGDSPIVLPTVTSLCYSHGIMMVESSTAELPSLTDRFASLRNGLAIGVCFPRKLPASLLNQLPQAPLNLHPSLLPRHRGPEPLFWTFHAGDRQTGVTIHQMDTGFDTGPIIDQTAIPLPLGSTWEALDQSLIELAASRLETVIGPYWNGSLTGTTQASGAASWARLPRPEDLIVASTWSAEQAYRFIHGVEGRFGTIQVRRSDGTLLAVRGASAFGNDPVRRSPDPGELIIDFADGWVSLIP